MRAEGSARVEREVGVEAKQRLGTAAGDGALGFSFRTLAIVAEVAAVTVAAGLHNKNVDLMVRDAGEVFGVGDGLPEVRGIGDDAFEFPQAGEIADPNSEVDVFAFVPDFHAGAPQAGVARDLLFERRGDRAEEGDALDEIELRGSGGEEVGETSEAVACSSTSAISSRAAASSECASTPMVALGRIALSTLASSF